MRIKIKRLPHCFALPEYKSLGAAGADVYATEDAVFPCGFPVKIPLGFALELPPGYEATIRPRSGLSQKQIYVVLGTIDSDYRGEVCATVDGSAAQSYYRICRGDRIAQLVISPVVQCIFEESEELGETERGESGFGSTGL